MKLHDLIIELQDLAEEFGTDDVDVFIATQPSYPLAFDLQRVGSSLEVYETNLDEATMDAEAPGEDNAVDPAVWLVATEGHPYQVGPYAPSAIFKL